MSGLLAVLAAAALAAGCGGHAPDGLPVTDLRVETPASETGRLPLAPLTLPDGKIIQVEVADSEMERERGLMHRSEIPADSGMLFVFPQPGVMQFWMKNTFVDLDMVFIDRRKKIAGIFMNVPASKPGDTEDELARRTGFGQFVLELPAGAAQRYGLENGQQLAF